MNLEKQISEASDLIGMATSMSVMLQYSKLEYTTDAHSAVIDDAVIRSALEGINKLLHEGSSILTDVIVEMRREKAGPDEPEGESG